MNYVQQLHLLDSVMTMDMGHIESEMTLAQYRMVYTDCLELGTNPAQRLKMVAHHLLPVQTELKLVM